MRSALRIPHTTEFGKPVSNTALRFARRRIGNTFVRCFIFALRQLFLSGIFLYVFSCWAQALLYWVPCTLYGDRPETIELDWIYPVDWKCEPNIVQHGFLNANLVFKNFGSTFLLMMWSFLAQDPQEVFSYVIQLADLEEYGEISSKKGIFTFFYVYYIVMILVVYNFVTAEVMQICDLLRFNMLHNVEVVFLRPKGHDFFYCIEWQLNMTSQRGGMIIEYYSKRLHQAQGDGELTIDHIDDRETKGFTTRVKGKRGRWVRTRGGARSERRSRVLTSFAHRAGSSLRTDRAPVVPKRHAAFLALPTSASPKGKKTTTTTKATTTTTRSLRETAT